MNLNETWKLCLSMYRWIAEQRRKGNSESVPALKEEWLRKHGFNPGDDSVMDDCFFCEYNDKHPCKKEGCNCPAKKIDPEFSCISSDYNYIINPIAFYNKLRSLNRKRTAKK